MKKDTNRIVTLAMFAAIIVVLQVVATFIRIGGFPITLTLIPIVVAGALYGVGTGALMGGVFGVIVLGMVVTGADPSGQAMLNLRPFITAVTCVLKGVLAGAAAAGVYRLTAKRNQRLAAFLAAAVCPVVNTGCLYVVLIAFFESTWAAMLSALISVNFLLELGINVLLAPGIMRIVSLRRKAS